ncbi:MAG: hypothetical protein KAS86_02675 [Candidatus Omnitrophica bacterium]|nr:hypothetical protein [Candidatus Omnitrophota bacterium]
MGNDKKKELRDELVEYFRANRVDLRNMWVKEMRGKGLLQGLSSREIEMESAAIYDTCIECLASENFEGAEIYARSMAKKGVLQGMTTEQIIAGMLTLRDVYASALCRKYNGDVTGFNGALSVYEPVADKILSIVAMAFVSEKTRDLEKAKTELEQRVVERTRELQQKVEELEKFNRFAINSELRMMGLKKRIKDLENRLNGVRE